MRSPLFNSNNLLMGDDQSSLSIALIGSDNPHSTFSVDAADKDVDADADAQEEDLHSREVKEQEAGERAEEAMNSITLIVAAADSAESLMVQHQSSKHPRLIPTFLSRTTGESLNAGGEPGYLAPAQHHRCIRGNGAVQRRERTAGSSRAADRPPSVQAGVLFPDRANHHGDNSASIGRQDTSGEIQAFCQLLMDFRTSLYSLKECGPYCQISLTRLCAPVWRAWPPQPSPP